MRSKKLVAAQWMLQRAGLVGLVTEIVTGDWTVFVGSDAVGGKSN